MPLGNLKLKQLLVIGAFLILIALTAGKFINVETESDVSLNPLDQKMVQRFVDTLPNTLFEASSSSSREIVGIHQAASRMAVVYIRYSIDNQQKPSYKTFLLELVQLDSGRWYSWQLSRFIDE